MRSPLLPLLAALSLSSVSMAAELRCVGVLGNSGEAGASLVRFDDRRDPSLRDGLGVVVDRTGTLWDRGGNGRLVRYALDGRALATVAIPPSLGMKDRLSAVGDTLVLLLQGRVHTIDTSAAAPVAVATELYAGTLSRGSADGRLLLLEAAAPVKNAERNAPKPKLLQVVSWNPVSGERSALPPLPDEPNAIELAEGRAYARLDSGRILRLDGATWTEAGICKEDRLQYVDGAWWTGAWHGTAKRFDANFAPAPGVVLGGASGSFIGHLAGNYEVNSPTGWAVAGPRLIAIGGMGGVVHLASWDPDAGALTLVRRIGALQQLRGHLAIDRRGRVHVPTGTWDWTDGPDAPQHDGLGGGGNGQVALLPSGALVASGFVYGTSPAMCWGTMDKELSLVSERYIGDKVTLPKDVTGCVALPADQGRRVLRVSATGVASETLHAPDGKLLKEVASGTATFSQPKTVATSLAVTADGRVLAGITGGIVELARGTREGDWSERARITSVAGQTLSGAVRIAGDGERLWLSDGGGHRVLVCSGKLDAVLATFGGGSDGRAGDDLAHLDQPAEIAAAGDRAVVYDAGNQRVLKLELK